MSVRLVNAGGRAGGSWAARSWTSSADRGPLRRGSDAGARALGRASRLGRGARAGAGDAPLDEASLGPCCRARRRCSGSGSTTAVTPRRRSSSCPKQPLVFTKFPNCLVGPRADVVLTSERVDYEVELVAVIGRRGRGISESRARDHVAGYLRGPGHLRPRAPVRRQAAAVLDGQVGRHVRADRAGRGVARRVRRPRRSAALVRDRRASGSRTIAPAT